MHELLPKSWSSNLQSLTDLKVKVQLSEIGSGLHGASDPHAWGVVLVDDGRHVQLFLEQGRCQHPNLWPPWENTIITIYITLLTLPPPAPLTPHSHYHSLHLSTLPLVSPTITNITYTSYHVTREKAPITTQGDKHHSYHPYTSSLIQGCIF